MDKLKPCPFCGSSKFVLLADAATIRDVEDDDIKENHAVVCDFQAGGCGAAAGYSLSEEGAVKRWNRRTVAENATVERKGASD